MLALAGCGSADEPGARAKAHGSGCPDGFAYAADRGLCKEILPDGDCPAGTMPELGQAECAPVGWTSCPSGFIPDPSGWGCTDAAPAGGCAGATRQDPRSASCVAIGDCNAAFPPADATVFVDRSYADDQLDATHFRSIVAAAHAAPSGAVVAVERGTYQENVDFPHAVTVVGRCAEQVVVASSGGNQTGLYVPGTSGVVVRGLTVSGFPGGVFMQGGELTLEDAVIDDSYTVGVYLREGAHAAVRRSKVSRTRDGGSVLGGGVVVYAGSQLSLEDAAIVDNYFRGLTVDGAGATLTAHGVFVARNVFASADEPAGGAAATHGGSLEISQSVLSDLDGVGILVSGGQLELSEGVVRRSRGVTEASAAGILVDRGGSAHVVSSSLVDHPTAAAYVGDASSQLTIEASVVLGGAYPDSPTYGRGAQATSARLIVHDSAFVGLPHTGIAGQVSADLELDHVLVRDVDPASSSALDFGILVQQSSHASMTRATVVSSSLVGIAVNQGSDANGSGVAVLRTREAALAGIGNAIQVFREARFALRGCALAFSAGTSVELGEGGLIHLESCTIHGPSLDSQGLFGHGVVVFPDGQLELFGSEIYDSPGVAIAASGGRALVRSGVIADNGVGLYVESGSSIVQSDSVDALGPAEVRVSRSTSFVGNGEKIGSGKIPLPPPP